MTQKEINEGNKLIAEFMGRSIAEQHGEVLYADWDGLHSVKYNESWDWLMPVVEKIEDTIPGSEIMIDKHSCIIRHTTFNAKRIWNTSKIQAAYEGVIEFIKWHNLFNQPSTGEKEKE
jgi:hypothetical protein